MKFRQVTSLEVGVGDAEKIAKFNSSFAFVYFKVIFRIAVDMATPSGIPDDPNQKADGNEVEKFRYFHGNDPWWGKVIKTLASKRNPQRRMGGYTTTIKNAKGKECCQQFQMWLSFPVSPSGQILDATGAGFDRFCGRLTSRMILGSHILFAEKENLLEDKPVAVNLRERPWTMWLCPQKAAETVDLEKKEGRRDWHCLVGATLKVLLEPVGIEVRMEVPVVPAPPVADIILIRRRENIEGGWTEAQRLRLADGLRDLDADQILVELKITESLNEKVLTWLSLYDTLYLDTAKLERQQLRSVIISSITPRKEFLVRHSFKPIGPTGVYESTPPWGGVVRLIFLNELADEPQNAPLKCFASRQDEQKKAFATIKHEGLFKLSVAFGQIVVGLWRLKMKGALNSPEMEGITPEYVTQLGKEWFASMVDATPEEELFSLPKFEHRLVQERLDSKQKGERDGEKREAAKILTCLLQRRFGTVPDWACEKVAKAEPPSLENWSLRIFDARSLDEVFSDKV